MQDISVYLDSVMKLEGAMAVAVFDLAEKRLLGAAGYLPIQDCVEGMALLIEGKLAVLKALRREEMMLDGLFTLETTYQVLKPVYEKGALIFAVFDKKEGNLAMIRLGLQRIAEHL